MYCMCMYVMYWSVLFVPEGCVGGYEHAPLVVRANLAAPVQQLGPLVELPLDLLHHLGTTHTYIHIHTVHTYTYT